MKKRTFSIVSFLTAACLTMGILAGCAQEISPEKYTFTNPPAQGLAKPDAGFVIDGVFDETEYQNQRWLRGVKVEKDSENLTYDGAKNDIDRAASFAMTTVFGENGIYVATEYKAAEGEQIYVNSDRNSTLNSITELYFAPKKLASIDEVGACEIDMQPSGDLLFKRKTADGSFAEFPAPNAIMAQLGTTCNGEFGATISEGSQRATEYTCELFLPWEFIDKIGGEGTADSIRNGGEIFLNAAPITSYNFLGASSNSDRWWWMFGSQLDNGAWENVDGWYHFNENGLVSYDIDISAGSGGAVMERFGYDFAVANNSVTFLIKADEGYSVGDIKVNEISYADSIVYTDHSLREGYITVPAEQVTESLSVKAEFAQLSATPLSFTANVYEMYFGEKNSVENASVQLTGPQSYTFDVSADGKIEGSIVPGLYTATLIGEGYEGYAPIAAIEFRGEEFADLSFGKTAFVQNPDSTASVATIDASHANDADGYITNVSGNAFFPVTVEKFGDSVFTVNFKLSQATKNNRHFIRYIFGDTMIALQPSVKLKNDDENTLWVEWYPDANWGYSSIAAGKWDTTSYEKKYAEAFKSDTGVNLTMVRNGADFHVFLSIPGDESSVQYFGTYTASGEYATMTGRWAVSVWDTANGAVIPFWLSKDETTIQKWLSRIPADE